MLSCFSHPLTLCHPVNCSLPGSSMEQEMATHSSILAERILWMEEPCGLLSIGLHRVGQDWSDFSCMHALEKDMATHSSILAWRIPETEEPSGLPSMGSHRVGHDWSDLAAAAAAFFGRESFATFAGENRSFSSQEPSHTVAMATEYQFSITRGWGGEWVRQSERTLVWKI